MKQVTRYDLQFNPATNTGAIFLQYADGTSKKLAVNSAQEFIAIAMILNHSPVNEKPDGTLEYKS
jgi:hypothetical protein